MKAKHAMYIDGYQCICMNNLCAFIAAWLIGSQRNSVHLNNLPVSYV